MYSTIKNFIGFVIPLYVFRNEPIYKYINKASNAFNIFQIFEFTQSLS